MSGYNKIKLNVVAHHKDNGDGSTTVSFYNTEEELDEWLKGTNRGYTVDDIKTGDDLFVTGTLTRKTIRLMLDEDGHPKLDGPFHVNSDD